MERREGREEGEEEGEGILLFESSVGFSEANIGLVLFDLCGKLLVCLCPRKVNI